MKNTALIGLSVIFFFLVSTGVAQAAGDKAKGEQVYTTFCVACHGPDPSKDGPNGPTIKKSSKKLLYNKVVNGKYPKGYKPKRATILMPPLAMLEKDIIHLFEFLK